MRQTRRHFLRQTAAATTATGLVGYAGAKPVRITQKSTDTSEVYDIQGQGEQIHFLSAENSTPFKEYYRKWGEQFTEETGTGVELEFVGVGSSQSARISKLLQAGNPPELTTTAPEKGGGLALQGVLSDLSEEANWMQETYGYEFNDDFLFQLQGNQYVVPIWVNMTMDWYRVDTWDEHAGMTPNELTWDEFMTALEQTDQKNDRRAHVIPAAESLMSTEFYIDYMFQNAGQIFQRNDQGEIELVMDQGENREKTKEVLQFLEEANQYSVDGRGYAYSEQIESYWSEQVNEVKYFGARPLQQAVANNEAVAEDTGLMHPPHKEVKTHQAFSEGWVMFEPAQNHEGAREFVRFMSRPEPLFELLHIAPLHNLPPFPEAVESEEFLDNEFIDTWVRPNENIRIEDVVEMVETAKTLVGETDPNNALASPVFSENTFGNMIFNYLYGNMSLDEAIDTAGEQSRSIIQNFQQG